jgi:hypothetical protein
LPGRRAPPRAESRSQRREPAPEPEARETTRSPAACARADARPQGSTREQSRHAGGGSVASRSRKGLGVGTDEKRRLPAARRSTTTLRASSASSLPQRERGTREAFGEGDRQLQRHAADSGRAGWTTSGPPALPGIAKDAMVTTRTTAVNWTRRHAPARRLESSAVARTVDHGNRGLAEQP